MIEKFKNWLGIEGVKLELLVPEKVDEASGFVDGRLVFTTKQMQTISEVTVVMYEKYIRGRGDDVKVDEYEIGRISLDRSFPVKAFEETAVNFALPFQRRRSNMDEFADKNLVAKGLAQVAKSFHKVKSKYKVVAMAKVKGTALNPFDEKMLEVK